MRASFLRLTELKKITFENWLILRVGNRKQVLGHLSRNP